MDSDLTKLWFVDVLIRGYADDDTFIREAFSPEFAAGLPYGYGEDHLSSIMWALGRFNMHVQYAANSYSAMAHREKRSFEKAKRDTILSVTIPASIKTEKGKEEYAYSTNPNLIALEEKYNTLETEARLYEKMPDRIQELIQIIKRELDRRNKLGGRR